MAPLPSTGRARLTGPAMREAISSANTRSRPSHSLSLHPMNSGRLEYGVSTGFGDRDRLRRWMRLQMAESRHAAWWQWCHTPDGTPLLMEGDQRVVITGYAVTFNSLSDVIKGRGFREVIRPGAFKLSLAQRGDIDFVVQHKPEQKIASTREGTLRLREDDIGLAVEITPPATDSARRVVDGIRRGDYRGLSISFTSPSARWHPGNGHKLRFISSLGLDHVAIVDRPAYRTATVAVELRRS